MKLHMEDYENDVQAKKVAWFGDTALAYAYNTSAVGRLQNLTKILKKCETMVRDGSIQDALGNLEFAEQELYATKDDLEKSIKASTPTNRLGKNK